MGIRLAILFALLAVLLVLATGTFDLPAARLLWQPGEGFAWQSESLAIALHELVRPASLALGGAFAIAALAAVARCRPVGGRDARGWLFLLAALIVGPGLLVNLVLKDHWHRARPHQIADFGGAARFTPPVIVADQCGRNCSFTAGDPAPGFLLHGLAYGAPPRRQRRWLAAGLAAGGALGILRMAMGAHFLSDVVWTGLVVVAATALLHLAFYGAAATGGLWRRWLRPGYSGPV